MAASDSLIDAKIAEAQARTNAEVQDKISDALLQVLEGQRQSDRSAFQRMMWFAALIVATVASASGVIIAVMLGTR